MLTNIPGNCLILLLKLFDFLIGPKVGQKSKSKKNNVVNMTLDAKSALLIAQNLFFSFLCMVLAFQRQTDDEGGAFPLFTFYLDIPAMIFDDTVTNRES